MAGLSIWHVVIFAIVVLLLFGTSKLKNLGKDVGGAVKDFKKSIKEDDEIPTAQLKPPRILDHEQNRADQSIRTDQTNPSDQATHIKG